MTSADPLPPGAPAGPAVPHVSSGPAKRPWLLLVPGLLCDATVWAPQVQALSTSHRCVVAEHGQANRLDEMARQALACVPGDEPFDLAGHSMGGRCALEIMRQAPQRVRRLALLDTGYQPCPPGPAGEAEARQRLDLLALARSQGMRAMGQQWLPGMLHPDQLGTALMAALLAMVERASPDRFEAQIQALLHRPDASALLVQVQVPTLVLCGRQDGWSPLARHQDMARLLPAAHLHVVEHCGHMSTLEQPQAVTAALQRWLAMDTVAAAGR